MLILIRTQNYNYYILIKALNDSLTKCNVQKINSYMTK